MSVRLKSVSCEGFRSFAEPTKVEFPKSGLLLFRGVNKETGGSSGSGKSNLLRAVAYGLGYESLPATELLSWDSESMRVTVELESDTGEVMTVSRGTGGLKVNRGGEALKKSAKELEAEITKFVGLSTGLLAPMTYRAQREWGIFLSKTDAEKKEFLTSLLGLDQFERAAESAADAVKKAEAAEASAGAVASRTSDAVGVASAALKQLEAVPAADTQKLKEQEAADLSKVAELEAASAALATRIGELNQQKSAAVAKVRQSRREDLQELERQLAEVTDGEDLVPAAPFAEAVSSIGVELEAGRRFLQEARAEDDTARREAQHHFQRLNSMVWTAQTALQQAQSQHSTHVPKLLAELESLKKATCPTCAQPWVTTEKTILAKEAEVARYTQLLLEAESLARDIPKHKAEAQLYKEWTPPSRTGELEVIVSELEARYRKAEQDYAVEKSRLNGERRVLIAEAEARVKAAQANIELGVAEVNSKYVEQEQVLFGEKDDLDQKLRLAHSAHRASSAALARAASDEAVRVSRVEQAAAAYEKAKATDEKAQGDLAATTKSLAAERDFAALIGRTGFLGAIFDEVLWEISAEANRLLAQFPNTAHVTLNFNSENETKKGTVQRRIVPVVSVGGRSARLESGLSGGMRTAVELAVDLAVGAVVSRRTGAMPGWVAFDESFSGLGAVEMEPCLELLQSYAADRLVLVVEHASEFKAGVAQHITIEYTNGKSRVV